MSEEEYVDFVGEDENEGYIASEEGNEYIGTDGTAFVVDDGAKKKWKLIRVTGGWVISVFHLDTWQYLAVIFEELKFTKELKDATAFRVLRRSIKLNAISFLYHDQAITRIPVQPLVVLRAFDFRNLAQIFYFGRDPL